MAIALEHPQPSAPAHKLGGFFAKERPAGRASAHSHFHSRLQPLPTPSPSPSQSSSASSSSRSSAMMSFSSHSDPLDSALYRSHFPSFHPSATSTPLLSCSSSLTPLLRHRPAPLAFSESLAGDLSDTSSNLELDFEEDFEPRPSYPRTGSNVTSGRDQYEAFRLTRSRVIRVSPICPSSFLTLGALVVSPLPPAWLPLGGRSA